MRIPSPITRAVVALTALVSALATTEARACAACACGDPTLTTLGADQPFAGRMRAATLMRAWGYTDGATGADIGELRLDLAVAFSPLDWLTLSAQLPLQVRNSWEPTGGEGSLGSGDLTLTARAALWRDRPFGSRWIVAAVAGAVLPTAVHAGETVIPATSPLTLGEGALSPLAGLSVLTVQGPWSAYASATGAVSFGEHAGPPALRTTLFGQRQLWPFLAVRLGAEARVDFPPAATGGQAAALLPALASAATHRAAHAGHEHVEVGPGLLTYASADALFQLGVDSQLQVGLRWPAFILGNDRPWPIVQAGFSVDL